MGSHYQFEDRLEKSVTIRHMHYSNNGLNNNNPSLDFLNPSYAREF
ncbi:acyloxyacyl hydrolase [Brumicola pallidula]|nr:acyloxyacyl hydrolase [Glaciecola pallidula]